MQYCVKGVCSGVAVQWLVRADACALHDLREVALAYVKEHFGAIRSDAEESLTQLQAQPELMLEVMKVISTKSTPHHSSPFTGVLADVSVHHGQGASLHKVCTMKALVHVAEAEEAHHLERQASGGSEPRPARLSSRLAR